MLRLEDSAAITQNSPTWFDWVVLLLGVLAFAVAMWQIFKTNGAAKEAKKALDFARGSLVRTQVITVVNDLKSIMENIDAAYAAEKHDALDAALSRFTFRAHEALHLLKSVEEETGTVESLLKDLAFSATLVRSGTIDFENKSLNRTITGLRAVVPQVHGLGVHMSLHPMTPDSSKQEKKRGWFGRSKSAVTNSPQSPDPSTVDELLNEMSDSPSPTPSTETIEEK